MLKRMVELLVDVNNKKLIILDPKSSITEYLISKGKNQENVNLSEKNLSIGVDEIESKKSSKQI